MNILLMLDYLKYINSCQIKQANNQTLYILIFNGFCIKISFLYYSLVGEWKEKKKTIMNNNDIKSIQKKDGYVFDNCSYCLKSSCYVFKVLWLWQLYKDIDIIKKNELNYPSLRKKKLLT